MGAERAGAAGGAGVIERSLLSLAWPLVLSFWLRAAFTWVDRIYAARLEGLADASQAAIGLAQPLEFLMIACWVGSSNALTSKLAVAMAAGQGEKVEQWKRSARVLVHALIALFVALAVGVWFLAERVGLEPDVARQFRLYASVLLGGSAFTMFWSILPDSIVKAHQDTRTTMWSGLISSVLNVVLNTLFVFGFGWGIVGIAFSTVLGRLGGLVYAQSRAAAHERARLAATGQDRPGVEARPVAALLGIAIPSGLTYVLLSVEGLLVNGILVRAREATEVLAAWSIWDAALRLMAMPAIAVGVAVLPLAARRAGRGDLGGLRRELAIGLAAISAFAVLLVWPAAGLLGPAAATGLLESERAVEYAVLGFGLMPLTLLVLGPMFLLRPLYDALGRPRRGLLVSATRTLLFVVPLTWLGGRLAPGMGALEIQGLYAGLTAGALLGTLLVAAGVWPLLGRRGGDA